MSEPLEFHRNIKVISNLEELLLRLRDPDEWGTLWIDAICINQEDIEERNEQVHYMHKIYHTAAEVLIWLGPEDE